MNRTDLEVALVMAHSGAVYSGAHHITTWIHEDADGEPDQARVTVHFPLRKERLGTDAYRLLEAMCVEPASIVITSESLKGVTRHGSAVVDLVVMLGSGVLAIAAARLPQPRDGDVDVPTPDDAPDRTSVLVDGAEQ